MLTGAPPTQFGSKELREERDRFVGFAFAGADLLLELDGHGVIGYAAGAARTLTGLAAADLPGRRLTELLAPSDHPIITTLLAALRSVARFPAVSVRLARSNAEVVVGACRLAGRPDRLHLSMSRRHRQPSDMPVVLDPATPSGLAGTTGFQTLLRHLASSPDAEIYTAVLVDIEGLGALPVTEEVRLGLARALGRQFQLAAVGGAAGQLGPERYALIQRGATNKQAVIAEIDGFTRGLTASGCPLVTTVRSLPLVPANVDAVDRLRALAYAVSAFAELGPSADAVRNFSRIVQIMASTAEARIGALRQCLAEREFHLEFQPVVSLAGRSLSHLEALCRFREGTPAEVVCFAEKVDLAADLDLAVVTDVTRRLAVAPEAPPVAVNLSGQSLSSPLFRAELLRMLRADSALPPRLLFEVTESARIQTLEPVRGFLGELREMGFRICIDDFGAGASSFQYIRSLPFDFLKIDGSYVATIGEPTRDHEILRCMAQLATRLGAAVIAEKIERQEQATQLGALGVALGQGYLFGRPRRDLPLFSVRTTRPVPSAVTAGRPV